MPEDDRDLGELCARVTQRLIAAERPLLARHGLEMWPYIVLASLDRGPARTQQDLARAIGYDKTRLIRILDELTDRGLIARTPDPSDRRARIVTLTGAGQELLRTVRADIRAMEDGFLADLGAPERRMLRRVLGVLADGD